MIVAFFLFTFRVKPVMEGSCVIVNSLPAEIELMYQSSPFQMNLCDPTEAIKQTLASGVRLVVSAQRSYWFVYYWGVDVQVFHQMMLLDWLEMKRRLLDGTLFTEFSFTSSEPELCYEREREIVLKPENITANDLGQSPRTKFPLVIAIILHGEDDDEPVQVKDTDAVALICAVHVEDELCTSATSFAFKLSKLANGQVLNVSTLFTRDDTEESSICLVCEARRVTIGLLPCRHFSLCDFCYEKLPLPKRCPVCRSYVAKFFRHNNFTEHQTPHGINAPDEVTNEGDFSSGSTLANADLPGPSNWFSRQMSRIFRMD